MAQFNWSPDQIARWNDMRNQIESRTSGLPGNFGGMITGVLDKFSNAKGKGGAQQPPTPTPTPRPMMDPTQRQALLQQMIARSRGGAGQTTPTTPTV